MRTADEIQIKSKLEDLEMDFSTDELWQKLQDRKPKSKLTFLLWPTGIAAGLLIGFLTFYRPDETSRHYSKQTASNTEILKPEKLFVPTPPIKKHNKKSLERLIASPQELPIETIDPVIDEPKMVKAFEGRILAILPKDFRPLAKVNIQKIKPIMKLKDRIVSFNLPLIPDEMLKKEPFAKRLGRQLRLFNTEGRFDWKEINVEPPAMWVFRKSTLDSLK